MKRVGILTFPNSPSFGASLQMYALYQTVSDMGAEVEIINYTNEYMKAQKHISKGIIQNLKGMISNIVSRHGRRGFQEFEKQICMFPKRVICQKEDLKSLKHRYDVIICGSDQVWNPYITGEDWSYLLDFCGEQTKRISYAPSFGVHNLEEKYHSIYEKQLRKFFALSVREESGRKIVEHLLQRTCHVVLDPSMLLTREQWKEQFQRVKNLPDHYIARFVFNQNTEVEHFLQELRKKTGLPVITVGGTVFSHLKKGRYSGSIGPREWLYIIAHADYVVTDSFHGAAFSIIFEREIYISLASVKNSRLITLAETFNLKNRIVDNGLDLDNKIDYQKVNVILRKRCADSLEYLKASLQ